MPSNTASIPMTTTLSCADAALLIINRPTIAPKIYAAPVLGALIPKIRFLITSKRINKTKISIISVAGSPIDCDAKAKAKIKAIAAYSKIGATNPSKKPSINAGGINCAFIYVPLNVQRHSSSRQVFLAALPLATIATNDGIANQQAQIPKRISTEQSQILRLPLLSIAEYLKVERAKIVVGAETTQRLYSQSIYISRVSSHYQKIYSKQSVNLFLSNPSERGNPAPMLNARLPQKTPTESLGQARCITTQQAEFLSGIMQKLKAQFRKRHYQIFRTALSYIECLLPLGSIMAINEDTKLEELERIKGELRELLPLLSKWRVEELQKLVSHHYATKWKHRKFRKYGSINKGALPRTSLISS